ncbi:hypothetical protein PHMEG_00024387 [Phytophthora megakarya]|uniref:Uncharacterized protein n=1 Tax=Phytophthora megakarya TaxID=4795 RepID=A0A225VG20_9STRA|nr:hypothetical protein PHMEG_00024387 [Phytophthora megakarya]
MSSSGSGIQFIGKPRRRYATLSDTIKNIRRCRQGCYYKLYTLFADRVRHFRAFNPNYAAPTFPTVSDYCAIHSVVNSKVLTSAWMEESTAMYGPLCELLMQKVSVRKVLRVDHSAKVCKKLKVWDRSGQRSSISDAKLLLLVQDEVGQIVGRRLIRSENNEETGALLGDLIPTLTTDGDACIYLVSDNANCVRGMVQYTFGGGVQVKQDPFHVIMRIKEKIWISRELMTAIYTVDRKLRPSEEMEAAFRRVSSLISPQDLSCTEAIWNGCVESNATRIRNGDMFVECNDYAEAHTTTQLEGFHSGLKKLLNRSLSVEVVSHNSLLLTTLCLTKYPSPNIVLWLSMFGAARVVSENVEAVLARPRHHWATIRELILLNSTSKYHRLSRSDFMTLLHLEPNDSESLAGFSQEENELLRQVRKEQTREKCSWSTWELVTNIMFNLAAESNTNSSFKLRQRSYTTIVAKLKVIADEKITTTKQYMQQTGDNITPSSSKNTIGASQSITGTDTNLNRRKLFVFDRTRPQLSDTNTNEQAFQIQLFQTIRESKRFYRKEEAVHSRIQFCKLWGALKRASNRGASLTIKLRVPQDTIFSSRNNQQVIQPPPVTLNSLKALNQIRYWNILSLTMNVQSTTQTHCQ